MFTLNFKQISTLSKRGGTIFSVIPGKECNVGQFISQILTRDEHGYIELMNPLHEEFGPLYCEYSGNRVIRSRFTERSSSYMIGSIRAVRDGSQVNYFLTRRETDDVSELEKYRDIENNLLNTIGRANEFIMKETDYHCTMPKPGESAPVHCARCPIGPMGSNSCMKKPFCSKPMI